MEGDLIDLIKEYYDSRKLTYPNTWEALAFATTELGEVYEILLSRNKRWVRNNPQNKPQEFNKEDFATESGDVIMMLIVAGIAEGVDPVAALKNKINKKLAKLKSASFTSNLAILEEEPDAS